MVGGRFCGGAALLPNPCNRAQPDGGAPLICEGNRCACWTAHRFERRDDLDGVSTGVSETARGPRRARVRMPPRKRSAPQTSAAHAVCHVQLPRDADRPVSAH